MTEQQDEAQEPLEGTQEPTGQAEGTDTQVEPQDDADEPKSRDETFREATARKEAKLRSRAKTAEKTVDRLQRQIVDSLLPGHVTPAAFWAGGASLPDLTAEDGTINPDKVAQAVQDVAERFGLNTPGPVIKESGKQPDNDRRPRGLADAFAPNRE